MKNAAPGPAAGFLFQPERALLHLAKGGLLVGIETTDDVVSKIASGLVVSEQLKSTLVGRNPFPDRSKNLWRTLEIWLAAIEARDVPPDQLHLYLVTNAAVPDGLARKLADAVKPKAIEAVVQLLLEVAPSVTGKARSSANTIAEARRDSLRELVKCIHLEDGDRTRGGALKEEISNLLHIPDDVDSSEIVQSLLGWVHDTCMELWRSGREAWLSRSAFKQIASRVISKHVGSKILERAADAIPISDMERRKHANGLFLRQIKLLEFSEEFANDYLIEALDDFIRYLTERTRLLLDGLILEQDLHDFEERLYHRWRMQSRRHWAQQNRTSSASGCECGQRLYQESIEHREPLAGVATEQYYLTRGSLHRLADEPRIGWHPDYRTMVSDHARPATTD